MTSESELREAAERVEDLIDLAARVGDVTLTVDDWKALSALLERIKTLEGERDELALQPTITVGGGLSVRGSIEAIGRVQDYILLDSTHSVEKEDVRRSLARALQAAEARASSAEAARDEALKAMEPFAKAARFYQGMTGGVHETVEYDDHGLITQAALDRASEVYTRLSHQGGPAPDA